MLPARITPEEAGTRTCAVCDRPLFRKYRESLVHFARRETCGPGCANRARRGWETVGEMAVQNSVVNQETGCWEWTGLRDAKGYGRIAKYNNETGAHRIVYADRHGPIPKGLVVMHACDNPCCINIDHLSLGRPIDNVVDRVRKGRCANSRGKDNANYRHGRYVGKGRKRAPATVQLYWDSLPKVCVCGKPSEHIHHIIHVNGQRITKDHWLVVPLCHACHNGGDQSVHALGGERQFLQATGWDLVQLAVLHRHNFEVRQ